MLDGKGYYQLFSAAKLITLEERQIFSFHAAKSSPSDSLFLFDSGLLQPAAQLFQRPFFNPAHIRT